MNRTTTIRRDEKDSICIIRIQGDLDSMGTQQISDSFNQALPDTLSGAVVDLSHVGFVSSAGMALLLMRGKALGRHGGRMAIANADKRVMEVLMLAGFHELFEVYDNLDEAIQALNK